MNRKIKNHKALILVTVMIATFMGRLDMTIVNLALPKIMSDFGITVSQAAWISTAYIIANAIFVPIFGKLGDLIGRKGLYLFGIIGFTITSALAGLAFNFSSMVFFRILQALTVSIDYPLALSIIVHTFKEGKERTQAMAIWSAIFASAVVFGPLVGGPLTDNFSWRSVFYINIPIGIIATIMAYVYINEPVQKMKGLKNFDVLGALLLGIFLAVLVLVLDQGQGWGWNSLNSWFCYITSITSLLSFLYVEKNAKEPIIDPKLFKIPSFSAAIVTSFISFAGFISIIFLIPLFAQNFLHYSVTKTGYIFVPVALCMGAAAQVGARLMYKLPVRYIVAFGMFLSAFGFYLLSGIDIAWGFWDMALRLMVFPLGLGLGLAPLTNASVQDVSINDVGVASSVLALARNIAGAFGIAFAATILSNTIDSNLINIQRFSFINTHDPIILKLTTGLMMVKANLLAFTTVFKSAAIIMVIAGLSAFFLKNPTKKSKPQMIEM